MKTPAKIEEPWAPTRAMERRLGIQRRADGGMQHLRVRCWWPPKIRASYERRWRPACRVCGGPARVRNRDRNWTHYDALCNPCRRYPAAAPTRTRAVPPPSPSSFDGGDAPGLARRRSRRQYVRVEGWRRLEPRSQRVQWPPLPRKPVVGPHATRHARMWWAQRPRPPATLPKNGYFAWWNAQPGHTMWEEVNKVRLGRRPFSLGLLRRLQVATHRPLPPPARPGPPMRVRLAGGSVALQWARDGR